MSPAATAFEAPSQLRVRSFTKTKGSAPIPVATAVSNANRKTSTVVVCCTAPTLGLLCLSCSWRRCLAHERTTFRGSAFQGLRTRRTGVESNQSGHSSQRIHCAVPFLRAVPPNQRLLDLHGPEDDRAKRYGDGEICERQRLCLQESLEEGSVDTQQLQGKRQGDRSKERLVRERAYPEERLVPRADGHDVAQLGEGQGGKHHRLPDLWCGLRVPQARCQGHERHQGSDPDDMAAKTPSKDTLVGRVRRTAHNVPLGRFRTQGQGGRTVGDQVDPEYLQRQQRQT